MIKDSSFMSSDPVTRIMISIGKGITCVLLLETYSKQLYLQLVHSPSVTFLDHTQFFFLTFQDKCSCIETVQALGCLFCYKKMRWLCKLFTISMRSWSSIFFLCLSFELFQASVVGISSASNETNELFIKSALIKTSIYMTHTSTYMAGIRRKAD